jgi:acyl-CoA reductase-like NAD-dependent aldehyde dehydrogenase
MSTDFPKHFLPYVGGQFLETEQPLAIHACYADELVATTYWCGQDLLEKAIVAAEQIETELRRMSVHQRSSALTHISKRIIFYRERLAHLLCLESGKPIRYALAEIDRAAQTFLVAAEECKRLPQEYLRLDWTAASTKREGLVRYFPIGIVAGISPFNFPMNLAVHKIAPAIAAGCPIILKPASATPLSTLALAHIIDETDLPKGAVSILPMDRKTGNQLVTDERIALLSFTGSPDVGWEMKRQAGKKKNVLELGGNAGVIVTPSANIEDAVRKCLVGGFAYSGQICIHAQRIFIHESIFEIFAPMLIAAVSQLKFGDPQLPETDVSMMIDEANAIRVEAWVDEALAAGAQLLSGGKRVGKYYAPTLLTNTQNTMKVVCEEVFGPVVILEKYTSIEEAVTFINASRFGLQAGIFTNDIREMDFAFEEIQCGGIILNDVPTFRVDHMPYGGVKDSGQGREGVKYALLDMLEARILVK